MSRGGGGGGGISVLISKFSFFHFSLHIHFNRRGQKTEEVYVITSFEVMRRMARI